MEVIKRVLVAVDLTEMDETLVRYITRLSNEIELDKVYFLNVTKNLELPEKIVEKYPDSQFMWWANAHAYYKKGDYQAAKSSYLTLYDLIIIDNKRNISHLLKCKFKLAVIHKELNEYEACQKQCNSILELSDKVELNDNSEDIVTRTTELMEDCENQIRVTNP